MGAAHSRLPAALAALASGLALSVAALAPSEALALLNYTGNVIAECHSNGLTSYNVKASIGPTSTTWFVTGLTYTFLPQNSTTPLLPASLHAYDNPADGGKTVTTHPLRRCDSGVAG